MAALRLALEKEKREGVKYPEGGCLKTRVCADNIPCRFNYRPTEPRTRSSAIYGALAAQIPEGGKKETGNGNGCTVWEMEVRELCALRSYAQACVPLGAVAGCRLGRIRFKFRQAFRTWCST